MERKKKGRKRKGKEGAWGVMKRRSEGTPKESSTAVLDAGLTSTFSNLQFNVCYGVKNGILNHVRTAYEQSKQIRRDRL